MSWTQSPVAWAFGALLVVALLAAVFVMLKLLIARRRDRVGSGQEPQSAVAREQRRLDRSAERGVIWGIGIVVTVLVAIVVIALIGGPVAEFFTTTWWLWVVFPGVGVFAYLIRALIVGSRRELPALDRTPRAGTVVQHRLWGDNDENRSTTVEYRTAGGDLQAATLADEIADQSVGELPVGSTVEVYAYQDPQYAKTAVFLTEKHDEVCRKGVSNLWGGDGGRRFPGPAPGSPFFGPDTVYRFAEPDPAAPESAPKPPRVTARATRILVVIAWIVAGLGMTLTGTAGVGTSVSNLEVAVPATIVCFFVAIGAMFLDGGTSIRRGTVSLWAVLRLLGVSIGGIGIGELLRTGTSGSTVGLWECAIGLALLLIPVAWGLLRRETGGATPRYEQKETRNLIACAVVPVLLGLAVIGVGRFVWWSLITQIEASSGIGIGVDFDDDADDGSTREIVVVPYKLDGLPTYQARVAAISLEDGELLWDRKLDSEAWRGYPVAVTSFDRPIEDGNDDTVVITTENGEFGFDLSWGDEDCGPGTSSGECSIEPGRGTLADTGEPVGEGFDLFGVSPNGVDLTEIDSMVGFTNERYDTVLDPATGEPAGDGFRVEYYNGVRIVAEDQVIAELAEVSSLQQVLVSPSGKVVLLMHGGNNKSVVVIASRDGFQRATVGDRGLVAWPAWMG